jgi:hypothetical protein
MKRPSAIAMFPLLLLASGCSGSADEVAAESPEFEAGWAQVVGGGAQVQHVAAGSDGTGLTGALGASATDGVSAILSSSIPSTGPLTVPEVDRAMRERMSAVRMCQAQASRREALPSGRVMVRFQVATNGSVQNVQVDGPRFARTTLLTCLASAVRRLSLAGRPWPPLPVHQADAPISGPSRSRDLRIEVDARSRGGAAAR